MTRLGWVLGLTVVGCDLAYPEVVITNQTAEPVQLRNVSFNGCLWEGVLAFGESTSPARCLPGKDRVHFQKFDAAAYCPERASDETSGAPSLCAAGPTGSDAPRSAQPMWFNYQTVATHSVAYGEDYRFEITLAEMEQDFSVPGPYGH
jgi:hypothetical protein